MWLYNCLLSYHTIPTKNSTNYLKFSLWKKNMPFCSQSVQSQCFQAYQTIIPAAGSWHSKTIQKSKLPSCCRPTVSLVLTFWLPLTRTDLSCYIRRRLGQLSNGKSQDLSSSPDSITHQKKRLAIHCFQGTQPVNYDRFSAISIKSFVNKDSSLKSYRCPWILC